GRAHSKEGKLQVELAQQRYYLPRLSGLGTSLSRLGGGIGTRGPGETKLESDRRHIRRRIDALSKELEELDKRRRLRRERRKKDMVTTVAIVGYTNAGKSTLLNTLTGAGVLAENKLFATLDTTSRSLLLPDGREVMLIDTVGLIRRLPHHLIQAFKSTLGEMSSADLILHICDASSVDCLSQMEVCDKLLEELGCGSIPLINVFNKCDIARDGIITGSQGAAISAKTGQGIDELLQKIAGKLSGTVQIEINIPYSKGSLGALIRANGKVLSEEFTPSGVLTKAIVDVMIIKELGECEIA
ncbi:MAG: GTPase HflX, partial [Oscillospiraceae bacterium]|nr:GTPase HflX [Oscillospiraceae bacterium]